MEINKIYLGNNLDTLKTFDDNSIDSIVTDPPYGLGKEPNTVDVLKSWLETGYHEIKGKGFMGKEWDAFVPQPILWKECLRILKPGGYLLSFAGTRTYDWVVMGLRIAGFEIRDQIAWVYGSGFPKSHDISKAIESKKLTGKSNSISLRKTEQNGKGKSYQLKGKNNGIMGEDRTYDRKEFKPSTDEAKQWQGWGSALKPALEPIVMARKPLEGTIANNVLNHGVGGINIDASRVPTEEILQASTSTGMKYGGNSFNESSTKNDPNWKQDEGGRFPANLIHDGSEEVVKLFPDTNPTKPHGGDGGKLDTQNMGWGFKRMPSTLADNGGSAARFFYTAKASQTERNFGLSGFEEKYTASAEFRPNHMEKALEGDNGNPYGRWQPKKNIHPTVKPIDLMKYLVRLVTPKGGICLDPYMGSGTTAIACKSEKINYIGCEIDEDYLKIAEARIKAEIVQYDIFDFIEEK